MECNHKNVCLYRRQVKDALFGIMDFDTCNESGTWDKILNDFCSVCKVFSQEKELVLSEKTITC